MKLLPHFHLLVLPLGVVAKWSVHWIIFLLFLFLSSLRALFSLILPGVGVRSPVSNDTLWRVSAWPWPLPWSLLPKCYFLRNTNQSKLNCCNTLCEIISRFCVFIFPWKFTNHHHSSRIVGYQPVNLITTY